MPKLKYTFAELLRILFELHKKEGMRQSDLAKEIGVALPTLSGWFNGKYKPRHRKDAERLTEILDLEPQEADLLLYSINHDWIMHGTDIDVLLAYDKQLIKDPGGFWNRLRSDPKFEKIQITYSANGTFITDGHHRFLAIKKAGIRFPEGIPADMYEVVMDTHYAYPQPYGRDVWNGIAQWSEMSWR